MTVPQLTYLQTLLDLLGKHGYIGFIRLDQCPHPYLLFDEVGGPPVNPRTIDFREWNYLDIV